MHSFVHPYIHTCIPTITCMYANYYIKIPRNIKRHTFHNLLLIILDNWRLYPYFDGLVNLVPTKSLNDACEQASDINGCRKSDSADIRNCGFGSRQSAKKSEKC